MGRTTISPSHSAALAVARIGTVTAPHRDAGAPRRRSAAPPAEVIDRGRLSMEPARHRVKWGHPGRDVTLTVTEFMILEALAQRPGVVKSRTS